jgi:hypothetical protein
MFMGPRNLFQGMNSASLCSLAGRYDNPIPPRFLAPIDFLKIPAPARQATQPGGIGSLESILGLLKSLKIRALYELEKDRLTRADRAESAWNFGIPGPYSAFD